MSQNQSSKAKDSNFKSFFQQTGLKIGGSYTRQKIRIALGKLYPPGEVLAKMAAFEKSGFIELGNANALSVNQDHLTIKKDFINGK